MQEILKTICKAKSAKKISDNLFQINFNCQINDKTPVKVFVKQEDGKFYLTDNKETLKFMSFAYELKATDVKNCINDVVKHYKFKIIKGEILKEINESNAEKIFFDFVMCIAQLANMFLFFDSPN